MNPRVCFPNPAFLDDILKSYTYLSLFWDECN